MADPILKFGNDVWAVRGGSETDRGAALAYDDQNSEYKSIPIAHKRLGGGSYVDRDGLIKYAGMHEPRVDFLNNSKGHLLLEPSSTNLVNYSEQFENSYWGKTSNLSISADYAISPDGTQNADRWVSSGGSFPQMWKTLSGLTIGQTYTASLYVKSDGTNQIEQRLHFTGFAGTLFTPSDKWVRITNTFTATSTSHVFVLFTNSGSAPASSYLIWGVQIEEGSYPTSYIPTDSYVVSRTNDDSIRSANEYILEGCNTEGVLYLEMAALFDDLTQRRITISDGTYTNRIVVGYNDVSNRIFYFVILAGATIASGSYSSATITDFNKVAIKWKANDFAMWVNGAERHTDTSGGVFSSGTLNVFRYANAVGSQEFFGKIKETKIFDTALSDSELQALTS